MLTPLSPASPLAPSDPTVPDGATDLAGAIRSALGHSGYSTLKDVACHVTDGVALLRGCVASYYLKQVAQAAAMDAAGVHPIVNRIDVVISKDARAESASVRFLKGSDESAPAYEIEEPEQCMP
jgi:hypothetical protein